MSRLLGLLSLGVPELPEDLAPHGIEPLPAPALRSRTVACLKADGLDVPALLAELKRRGHQVGNGYGKLKDATFRIGHMGDHTEADLEQLLGQADEALALQGR
jgi:aspartate aminotransferase-like enzyme